MATFLAVGAELSGMPLCLLALSEMLPALQKICCESSILATFSEYRKLFNVQNVAKSWVAEILLQIALTATEVGSGEVGKTAEGGKREEMTSLK